jgi:hypothetical protein
MDRIDGSGGKADREKIEIGIVRGEGVGERLRK